MASLKPPTPKVNFLVKSKTETKPISSTMKYLFLLYHVVFALDFGFIKFKSPRTKKLFKLLTFCQSTACILAFFYGYLHEDTDSRHAWFYLDTVIFYICTIIVLLMKDTYYDFQLDLHSFDAEIQVDSDSYKSHYVLFFCCLSQWILRCSITIVISKMNMSFSPVFQWGHTAAMYGFNSVLVIYAFLFVSVYCRMKKFTSYVQNQDTDVVSCHYLYKSIVDIAERAKKTFDLVVSILIT